MLDKLTKTWGWGWDTWLNLMEFAWQANAQWKLISAKRRLARAVLCARGIAVNVYFSVSICEEPRLCKNDHTFDQRRRILSGFGLVVSLFSGFHLKWLNTFGTDHFWASHVVCIKWSKGILWGRGWCSGSGKNDTGCGMMTTLFSFQSTDWPWVVLQNSKFKPSCLCKWWVAS